MMGECECECLSVCRNQLLFLITSEFFYTSAYREADRLLPIPIVAKVDRIALHFKRLFFRICFTLHHRRVSEREMESASYTHTYIYTRGRARQTHSVCFHDY